MPDTGSVGGAVVGQDAFDDAAAVAEPGNCSVQDGGRRRGSLVGVDLGVGDTGVVVDDRVQKCLAGPWFVVVAFGQRLAG